MQKKGLMVVVSGPAGSGKGTVNAHLLATGEYVYSVSATTRAPRPGEVEGQSYYFVSREQFLDMIQLHSSVSQIILRTLQDALSTQLLQFLPA